MLNMLSGLSYIELLKVRNDLDILINKHEDMIREIKTNNIGISTEESFISNK